MTNVSITDVVTNVTIDGTDVNVTVGQGQSGIGVPAGGTTGQVLAKTSATDYATAWTTPSAPTSATYFDFDTATAYADAVARLRWDSSYSTLSLGLDSDVQVKIGQGLYKLARNNSGSPIAKGEVVYVNGSHGGTQLTVALASNTSEATSAETVGVAAEAIANNSSGFVQTFGYLEGITTNGYAGAEGSALYLSATAGTMQSGLPTQPAHGVRVGFLVKKAGGGAGSIFVNVQNYQELEELSDVLVSSLANGHVLVWDSIAGVWKNQQISALSLAPNSVGTTELKDKNVTFAKLQDLPTQTLIGRGSIGTGTAENVGLSSDFGIDPATFELKLSNRSANSIFGRSAGTIGAPSDITATADGQVLRRDGGVVGFGSIAASSVTAPGSTGQVMFNSGGAFAGDAGFTYDAATDTLTIGSVVFANGESIVNAVDGSLELAPNGTSATHFGMVIDGTSWGSGVKLSTKRRSDGVATEAFWFNSPLLLGNGVPFAFGTSRWYTMSYQETGGQACLTVGLVTGAQTSGSSGAFVVCVDNTKGSANRIPTTDHADPTLYVYARGNTSAADYVRVNHDTTDGTIESGNGRMIVKGATAVRIATASGGFDLPATAGSNGQVLTTNGTSASWQTPSGGGGGISEEDAVALAVAL